eukprot:172038-Pyramimonas_sp.AAC.1
MWLSSSLSLPTSRRRRRRRRGRRRRGVEERCSTVRSGVGCISLCFAWCIFWSFGLFQIAAAGSASKSPSERRGGG